MAEHALGAETLGAKERHIDLIVVGTHGASGVEKLALGSIAEEIFRRCDDHHILKFVLVVKWECKRKRDCDALKFETIVRQRAYDL